MLRTLVDVRDQPACGEGGDGTLCRCLKGWAEKDPASKEPIASGYEVPKCLSQKAGLQGGATLSQQEGAEPDGQEKT